MEIKTPKDIRLPDGKIIHFTTVMGTLRTYAAVYEPTNMLDFYGGHHAITSFKEPDGTFKFYGMIGTRAIPRWIDEMSGGSVERIEACRKWREDQRQEAFKIMRDAGVIGKEDDYFAELEIEVRPS